MLTTLVFIESDKKEQIDPADHIGMAQAVAGQFVDKKTPVKDSEEYAEACLRLVQLADNYDPADGEFRHVAWRQMKQAVIDSYRRQHRQKRKGKFDAQADLNAIQGKEENVPLPVDELLNTLLANHPDETAQDIGDKLLLLEVYLGGSNVPSVAERFCVTRQAIYNRLNRCLRKIRERHASLLEQYEESS